MAERRMFSKTIIDSDAFLDMPLSTQALYFHLSMRADDDGFVNNSSRIMRMINATKNDHDLLIVKGFIIPFQSGICVIKHWRIHNYLRSDRYKATTFQEERATLSLNENGAYSLGIPMVDQMEAKCLPLVDAGKDRLGKVSIDKSNILVNSEPEIAPCEVFIKQHPSEKSLAYKAIITYLNEKAKTAYRWQGTVTQRHINARLSEGFSLEDFKVVIDKKTQEWCGGEMEKFLRPETLFGTKFEGYLNQSVSNPKGKVPPAVPQTYTAEQLASLFHSLDGVDVEKEEI